MAAGAQDRSLPARWESGLVSTGGTALHSSYSEQPEDGTPCSFSCSQGER